ncbi:MAG TPA: NAD(P)-binding domain-containing protein [Gemmatimonadaceae bacterium]|jgi:predicted dinucleotide-binding enzyme|nr:NAD(P)-binding domain-containing protein [Gemmatimonadaceae bacterium]
MKIGIIGAGHIGGTLARRLSALGHEVSIANSRGPETLAALESQSGAKAVTLLEAARGKDLVIVAIPEKSVRDLPKDLFAQADRTVVVDTGNYYPQRDGRISGIEEGTPESLWVSQQLGRPVVKAFNTMYAKNILERGRAADQSGRLALPVAGDDPEAKALVLRLIDELGFDGVDTGKLADSWRQQPGTPVYGAEMNSERAQAALGSARRERPAEFRAASTA